MPRPISGHGASGSALLAHAERLGRMEASVRTIIKGLGEDVEREGLWDTPKRVAKALIDVTCGYRIDPSSVIGSALFHESIVKEGNSGIVLVRDIDFASTSEESLMPFHGRCHIAYVPADGVVLGLSKLARLTKYYSKRLQSQPRLCSEIAAALQRSLPCSGVAVVLQARHLGSGPQLPPITTTASVSGCFAQGSDDLEELQELLDIQDLAQHLVPSDSHPLAASPSAASMGLSEDSETTSLALSLGSVAAPHTPDASEKDTDGDSDDVAMEAPEAADGMEGAVQQLLLEVGEDPARPGLRGTAQRYIMTLLASTSGYHQKLPEQQQEWRQACSCQAPCAMDTASAPEQGSRSSSNMSSSSTCSTSTVTHEGRSCTLHHVAVPFHSQCEHHMLPFYGHVHIAWTTQTATSGSAAVGTTPAASGTSGRSESEQQTAVRPVDLEQLVAMYTQRLQVQERITHQVADVVSGLPGFGGDAMVVVDAAHMCMVARGVENHSGSTTSAATRGAFAERPELRRAVLREARRCAMRCT